MTKFLSITESLLLPRVEITRSCSTVSGELTNLVYRKYLENGTLKRRITGYFSEASYAFKKTLIDDEIKLMPFDLNTGIYLPVVLRFTVSEQLYEVSAGMSFWAYRDDFECELMSDPFVFVEKD